MKQKSALSLERTIALDNSAKPQIVFSEIFPVGIIAMRIIFPSPVYLISS